MRSAYLIAKKDLTQAVRNRSLFVLGILAPLAIMAVMDLTMGDVLSGSFNPVIHVVDPSGSSDDLIDGLREAGFNNVELADSPESARAAVDDDEADAAIIFPPDLILLFQDPDREAEIEVLTKPDSEVSAAISRSIAESTATRYRTIRASVAVAAEAGQPPTDDTPAVEPVITVDESEAGTRILSDATYFAVGMASFFVFFTAQAGITTLHNERRESTLARMLASPSPRWAPLAGKAAAALVTGLIAFLVLWGLSTLLLGADWGPPLGVLAVAVAAMIAAVGLGAFATALTSTGEAASALSGVITTALAIFGGTFVQVPATGLLAGLSRLSPFRWIMDGIGQNAGVGSSTDVLISAAVLSLFGLVAGAIAFARRGHLLGGD